MEEYLPLAILFIMATVLAFLVMALGHLFGPRRPTQRKSAPYESGMKPIGPGTRRISMRYYLVAVMFILFDIEIVFFLPWAVALRSFIKESLGIFAFVEMTIFIVILLVGYVYAWKKGALEWE